MAMSLTPPIQTHYDGSFDSVKGESWINHRGTRDCRDRKQALIPKMILAGVVGFEPTNGGFRIRCLNRTWRYPSTWCGRRDSNSHDSRHSHLKAARLPISPRPLALEKNYCLPRVIPSQPGKNTGTGCKAANINAEPGWIASHPSQQALRSRLQREPASSVRSSPYRARRLDAADSAC